MAIPTNPDGSVLPVFEWAVLQNDDLGRPTKINPTPENKQTGLVRRQPWPRTWHNYAFNNHGQYIAHLTNDPLGTIKMAATAANIDPKVQWGGTWVTTTDTIGGVATDVFRKTVL